MPSWITRKPDLSAALLLLLLPAVLLFDSLFLGRHYMPFDLAEMPPVSTTMSPDDLARVRDGATYDASEPPIWFAPEMELFRRGIGDGGYPHWNPYARGGAPLTAHGLMGFLEPSHWPALLFEDPRDGLLYLTYLMYALAGLLMYGLMRELAVSRPAALFAAVAFTWSGTLASNGHWYMRMEPLALLPGMLWALLRIDRTRGWRRAVPTSLFAVAMAMSWSASFPPYAIPCTLFCGLFAVALAVLRWRSDGRRTALVFLGWAALAAALGLSLAAGNVLQQALFFPVSNRPVSPTLASASRFAFDPAGLLGFVLPEAFSHPGDRLMPGGKAPLPFLLFSLREWGTGALLRPDRNYNFSEYAIFPGTLPLLLAGLAVCARGPRWRLLGALALLLCLLLATGAGPFRYAFLVPGVQAVPPYRFAGLACVFVAVLAGLGIDRLRRGDAPWAMRGVALAAAIAGVACLWTSSSLARDGAATEARWLSEITEHYRPLARTFDPNLAPHAVTDEMVRSALFTGRDAAGQPVDLLQRGRLRLQGDLDRSGTWLCLGALFLLAVSLRGRHRPLAPWLFVPALLATAGELWWHDRPLNRGLEMPFAVDSPVHEFLRQQQRAAAPEGGITVARANPGGGDPMHLPPGTLAVDRIRDLHFYTYVDKYSSEPIRALYGDDFMLRDYLPQALPDDERLQLPWWDAMGIRYLLTTRPMRFAGVQVGPHLQGPGGEFFVYERTSALPRAWVVPDLRAVGDEAAMVRAAIAPDFAPRRHALVTDEQARLLPPLPRVDAAADRRVTFEYEDLKRLTLHVSAGPPGYLVVADTMLPGWTATLDDGTPVPLGRGNVYQRIVPLPAGECSVLFRYRTPGLAPGLALAGIAVGFVALLLVLARRARAAAAPTSDATDVAPAP